MRFLFTTTPGFSHTVPLVPLAHAARLAGHQVLFAAGGPALRAAAHAGLSAVDAAPGTDVTAPYIALASSGSEPGLSVGEVMNRVFGAFGEIGDLMLPGLVRIARDWQADVVLYPPMLPAGILAARAAGSLAVVHGIGLRHPLFPLPSDVVPPVVAEAGVTSLPLHPDVELSLGPESLEKINPTAPTGETLHRLLDLRPSTYNGGGQVPAWALTRPERPRVLVTMGSVPTHNNSQGELLGRIIRGTERLDAEIVVTTGGSDLPALLGELPERVRLVEDFLPLSAVLPSCAAAVHHGGMSTMFAALTAGVPQLIVPTTKGDARSNGVVLEQRGAGTVLDPAECTADAVGDAIGALLSEPSFRAVSQDVSTELAAMPDPGVVVDRLAALARARG
ncbi:MULTISPECIES: glycosyltransferase [Streptomyces]|uniref:glycosyltransferase n=1 Tax=Streptomyces TaxID=1883 RepID=UPI0004C64CD1|nr:MULTISPECIES: glycosyltransferase [Streptomyces]RPK83962.1 L-noviosyl transferase [Streptomyces sp. ADI98-10]